QCSSGNRDVRLAAQGNSTLEIIVRGPHTDPNGERFMRPTQGVGGAQRDLMKSAWDVCKQKTKWEVREDGSVFSIEQNLDLGKLAVFRRTQGHYWYRCGLRDDGPWKRHRESEQRKLKPIGNWHDR